MNTLTVANQDFFRGSYPIDHPCRVRPQVTSPDVVDVVTYKGYQFAICLRPDDGRGYATTTRYLGPSGKLGERESDPGDAVNRTFTKEERDAFHTVQAHLERAYERLGVFPQHCALGNEALSPNTAKTGVCRGNRDNPYTLSCVTVGRGTPGKEYVSGVPLLVPPFGANFDIDGNGGSEGQPKEYQNKVGWEDSRLGADAQVKLRNALRATLQAEMAGSSSTLGLAGEALAEVEQPAEPKLLYYQGRYDQVEADPEDEKKRPKWALDPQECANRGVIAVIRVRGADGRVYRFSVFPIPPDSRGYRVVVRLLPEKEVIPGSEGSGDWHETFNRDFTLQERIAAHRAAGVVERMYESMGLVPQQHMLGNVAHNCDNTEGIPQGGRKGEPFMLHFHTLGCGIPGKEYVQGVPLEGPPPGKEFDISCKGGWPENREGNTGVPWIPKTEGMTEEEKKAAIEMGVAKQKKVVAAMREKIATLQSEYAEDGVAIDVGYGE